MVYCNTACGWKGELGSLDNHKQKDCENSVVFCENNCGETNISRKNLQAHLESKCPNRLHKCPDCGANNQYKNHQLHTKLHCPKRLHSCVHCGENGCFDERTSTHLEVCPNMKIACKKCTQRILRCQLPTHPKKCMFQPVPCKYSKVGCKVRPLRKDLKKHEEDDQLHLRVTTETVLELKKILPKPVTPVTFRVTDFDKSKTDNDVIYSPSFYTSKNGYKMCLRIYVNGNSTGKGTHVSVFTCLLIGEYDDYLTWPFTGTFTIELLNQLENQNHHHEMLTIPADKFSEKVLKEERRGRGYPEFISHTDLAKQSQCQYLKDNTLIFRVSVVNVPDYKQHLECIN